MTVHKNGIGVFVVAEPYRTGHIGPEGETVDLQTGERRVLEVQNSSA